MIYSLLFAKNLHYLFCIEIVIYFLSIIHFFILLALFLDAAKLLRIIDMAK